MILVWSKCYQWHTSEISKNLATVSPAWLYCEGSRVATGHSVDLGPSHGQPLALPSQSSRRRFNDELPFAEQRRS